MEQKIFTIKITGKIGEETFSTSEKDYFTKVGEILAEDIIKKSKLLKTKPSAEVVLGETKPEIKKSEPDITEAEKKKAEEEKIKADEELETMSYVNSVKDKLPSADAKFFKSEIWEISRWLRHDKDNPKRNRLEPSILPYVDLFDEIRKVENSAFIGLLTSAEREVKIKVWEEKLKKLDKKYANGVAVLENEIQTIRNLTLKDKDQEKKEGKEEMFSREFLKERINSLLKGRKEIKRVDPVVIDGSGNFVTMSINNLLAIKEGKLMDTTVEAKSIKVKLENSGDTLTVKDIDIEAGRIDKGIIAIFLGPKIKEMPQILKEYIEKEKGKEVQKIKIESGELKVTYK